MHVMILTTLACSGGGAELATSAPGAAAEGVPVPEPIELEAADGVAAADLDGDGVDELLFVSGTTLSWPGGTHELQGVLQEVARGDIDGDGDEEAILGSGMGRVAREAPAQVWAVHSDRVELLWRHEGSRNQVTDLRVVDGKLWLAAFEEGQRVQAGWLVDGALTAGPNGGLSVARLAPRHLPVSDGVVYGRIYGDEPRSDGDLRLSRGAQDTQLPSLRGVRSIASADLNADGHPELFVGDGWHYAYGQQAVGRVLMLVGPDWTESRVVAQLDEEYSARQIEVLGRDLIVTGTRQVHLLRLDDLGWVDHPLAPISESNNAVAARSPNGQAVLVAGEPSRLVHLPR